MGNIIELNNIAVQFQQKKKIITAVEDATIHIEKGDIYGIIGYSGAGKSTLVRTINLLQVPTSGQILVNGETVFDSDKKEVLTGHKLRNFRQKIGMIFQHFNLLSEKTVYQNVLFALAHTTLKAENGKERYLTSAEKKEKVNHLLELVDLSELSEKYPAQLSGGQKQRVAIARALANDPEILISDEGTSALDPKTTNQILDLLKHLHEELGITIILITHEMHVVKEIANKVAVMQNGQVIEQNSLVGIFSEPQEELTEQFIETTSSVNRFIAGIAKTTIIEDLADDEELIHLDFSQGNFTEPVISHINKSFDVTTSILSGNVEQLQDKPFGSLVIVLKGSKEARTATKDFLIEHQLKFKVLKSKTEVN